MRAECKRQRGCTYSDVPGWRASRQDCVGSGTSGDPGETLARALLRRVVVLRRCTGAPKRSFPGAHVLGGEAVGRVWLGVW